MEDQKFICKTCCEEFASAAEKMAHQAQAKCVMKRYFCQDCSAGFTRRYNLDQHRKKCFKPPKLPILIKPKEDTRIKDDALQLIETEIKPRIGTGVGTGLAFSKKVEANVVTYTFQFTT
jgi:hypothetical protein